MFRELTKPEKKLARELVNKGLQQKYQNAIKELSQLIDEWKDEKLDNRGAYLKLYKAFSEHDKHIASRYDDMKGSKYFSTVASLLADELITQKDILGFNEENRNYLNRYAALINEDLRKKDSDVEIIKGYRVKVEYADLSEEEMKRKREAIAKTAVDSILKRKR
ncbi:MAG: hypothetical protein JWO03_3087 [Bacteroidetes bacterium]|nr:hypothetical protein [Bacteroidota bacterium]